MWLFILVTLNFDLFQIRTTPVTLTGLVLYLANLITTIAAVVAFFVFIYSGFLYLTAGGNPDQAKKGQQGIVNAIIGLIIIAFSYVLLAAVSNFINTGGLI